MVAVGSSSLIVAKMMTCICAIFTVLSLVTAANFRVTGVEYRLLTTLIVSSCATLWSYASLGSIMSETTVEAFFDICSLLREFSVVEGGGGVPVVMICLVGYVCRKAKKILFF